MKKVVILNALFLMALLFPTVLQAELRHYEAPSAQQEQQVEKKQERKKQAKRAKAKDERGFFQKLFKPQEQAGEGAATMGLIFGALGLVFLLLTFATGSALLLLLALISSIVAVVTGLVGMQSAKRGSAIAGLIMGIVTFVIIILIFALAAAILASI